MVLERRSPRKFTVGLPVSSGGALSDEHFTVDGTLVEAWASLKSFKRKDAGAGRFRLRAC